MRSFQIAGGVFTIRLGPTILTSIMLIALLGLGTWQVQRLQWKESLIHEIETRQHLPAIDVAEVRDPQHAEYTAISARGILQNDREMYLNSVSKDGEGGYHVLTPLLTSNGRYVLIDRGWVPYDKRDPATRPDGQFAGTVMMQGLLRLPHAVWMQAPNDPLKNNWYGYDLKAMADYGNIKAFMPFILAVDAMPVMGGYPVGGQTRLDIPNNHLSYAMTWYGLALALLIIYGVSSWRKGLA